MHHVHHDLKVYGGIKLYAGSGSPELSAKIAEYLGQPLSACEVIEFPNENLFIKLNSSVRGQDVYVIQTTSSPVHRNLMELLITIQTLRLDSAARITAVVPYLCYGRSDKKDQPRVPITARLVADMIEAAGADRYMTLDPHAGQIQGFFSIPGDVLTASHMLIHHINQARRKDMKDPVVVSVDLGFAKKGRCTFLEDDRCSIHDSGFKPKQCRECLGCQKHNGPDNYEMARHWDTKEGKEALAVWAEINQQPNLV